MRLSPLTAASAALALMLGAAAVLAQPSPESSPSRSDDGAQQASQGRPDAAARDDRLQQLETMARTDVTQFQGLRLLDPRGQLLGEVLTVRQHRDDRSLFAVIAPRQNAAQRLAIPFQALNLTDGELQLREEAGRLTGSDQSFITSELRPLEQEQTAPPEPLPAGDLRELAEQDPAALEGQALLDEAGQSLGQVREVVMNKEDQALYVIVAGARDNEPGVLPLTALRVVEGSLRVAGELDLRPFRRQDFVQVRRPPRSLEDETA